MTPLTENELLGIAKRKKIIREVVIRPTKKRIYSHKEKLNNSFANVATVLTCYSVGCDEKLRDLHEIANSWKNEDPELVKDVLYSYTSHISKSDISKIVDNAYTI